MHVESWPIDFRVLYPENCTPVSLLGLLEAKASNWLGWDRYPWRVTRNIHRFIDTPPVNFHYLLIQDCVAAHAAHLVLNAHFENRNEVFDMMIREEFQFAGVLRAMLIDAIRYKMRSTNLPYIRDCTGLDEGHTNVTAEEIEKRRRDYREAIEGAEKDFVRIVNMASMTDNMDELANGRSLRLWARGGDLPALVMLQVRIEETDGMKVILPQKREAAAFAKAGKTVPKLVIQTPEQRPRTQKPAAGAKEQAEPDERTRGLVASALLLAQELDGNPRVKAPNHMTVLKMYCLDGLSVLDIQKQCKCAHGTVMNRKKVLETRLGAPLDQFRELSGIFEGMAATLSDGRARSIYRRGLVDDTGDADSEQ